MSQPSRQLQGLMDLLSGMHGLTAHELHEHEASQASLHPKALSTRRTEVW